MDREGGCEGEFQLAQLLFNKSLYMIYCLRTRRVVDVGGSWIWGIQQERMSKEAIVFLTLPKRVSQPFQVYASSLLKEWGSGTWKSPNIATLSSFLKGSSWTQE